MNKLAIIYLLIFLILSVINVIFSFINRKSRNRFQKSYLFFLIIALLSFSVIAFNIEPPFEWDLYKHYQVLEKIRTGGVSYLTNYSPYKELYVINYFYYLISLTNYNGLLPFFTVLICGIIFIIIYKNLVFNNKNLSNFVKIFIILIYLALFNIVLAVSGIRTNLSVSICALGFFLEYLNKRNFIVSLLLYIISLFIHPVSVIFIISRLLVMLNGDKYFIIFAFISLFFYGIIETLSSQNIPIIQYIMGLINVYQSEKVEYTWYITIANLLFVLIYLFNCCYLYIKCKITSIDVKISLVYSCFCLGLIFNLIFFYRCIMFLSFLAIFVYSKYFMNKNNIRKDLTLISLSIYSLLILFLNIIQLMSVITW